MRKSTYEVMALLSFSIALFIHVAASATSDSSQSSPFFAFQVYQGGKDWIVPPPIEGGVGLGLSPTGVGRNELWVFGNNGGKSGWDDRLLGPVSWHVVNGRQVFGQADDWLFMIEDRRKLIIIGKVDRLEAQAALIVNGPFPAAAPRNEDGLLQLCPVDAGHPVKCPVNDDSKP